MTYQGSKERIAPVIVRFLEAARQPGQVYYEPFVGSMAIFERMRGPKIGGDAMVSLVMLWQQLIQDTFIEPSSLSKQEYYDLVRSPQDSALKAYAGFFWSFSSLFGKGYSPNNYASSRSFYEAQQRAERIRKAKEPFFLKAGSYEETCQPKAPSLIYCDIPYRNTEPYRGVGPFDHEKFYAWCHRMKHEGNTVYISEYEMPADLGFFCCFEHDFSTALRTSKRTQAKPERIFTL